MLNLFKKFLFLTLVIDCVTAAAGAAAAAARPESTAKFMRCERGGKVTPIQKKVITAFKTLIAEKGIAYFGKENGEYSFTIEKPGTMFSCRRAEQINAITCSKTGDLRVDMQSNHPDPVRGVNIQAQYGENTVGGLILVQGKPYSVEELTNNLILSIEASAIMCDEGVVKAEGRVRPDVEETPTKKIKRRNTE